MPRLAAPSSLGLTALLILTLGAAAACGSSGPTGSTPSATSAASASGSVTATSSPPTGATAAGCGTSAWQTAPVSVTRQVAVPPVPVVTAVRTARHPGCGYERLVLDISGPLPGYTIRYASTVTADPSGHAITVPGRHFLLITLRPAQAHTSSDAPTIIRHAQVVGYPMLTGWALASDFEGIVTLAVGLDAVTGIRIGELPGRLYIDFKA